MNSAAYLEQVVNLRAKIQNKIDEIERLELLSTDMSISLSDIKVQSSPNPHRLSNVWDRLVDARAELLEQIEQMGAKEREIIATIEKLPTNEYNTLYKYYIKGLSIEGVAAEMNYSVSSVGRFKSSALTHLQSILNDIL